MTDGTSQGLFIVVAIVIFGIFTVLAYILFEDTLSPALASMFTDATEQAANTLLTNNLYHKGLLEVHGLPPEKYTVSHAGGITFTNHGSTLSGIRLKKEVFKKDTNYMLSFKTKKLDGNIYKLGGHLTFSEHVKVYIDGDLKAENTTTIPTYRLNGWYQGLPYANDTKEHEVTIYFDTNYLTKPDSFEFNEDSYVTIYLQPNRGIGSSNDYKIRVSDIYLKELK